MKRLPPILARDYRRNIIWPLVVQFVASLAIGMIALVVTGFLP